MNTADNAMLENAMGDLRGRFAQQGPRPGGARGFTLIEMLTVVAISLIMLLAGVPTFASYLANQRVSAASRDLMQDLIAARTESARTGFRARLVPKAEADWTGGWEVVRNIDALGDESTALHLDDAPITADRLGVSACIDGAGVAPRIEFDAMGELVTPDEEVRVTLIAKVGNFTAAREVVVAPSGRAETVRIDGEDADLACG